MALRVDGKLIKCPYCGSQRMVKNGTGGKSPKQMFLCRSCNRVSRNPRRYTIKSI